MIAVISLVAVLSLFGSAVLASDVSSGSAIPGSTEASRRQLVTPVLGVNPLPKLDVAFYGGPAVDMSATGLGPKVLAQLVASLPSDKYQVINYSNQPVFRSSQKVYVIPPGQNYPRYSTAENMTALKSWVRSGAVLVLCVPYMDTANDAKEVAAIVSRITSSVVTCKYPNPNCWTGLSPVVKTSPWPSLSYGASAIWPATLTAPAYTCVLTCTSGNTLYKFTGYFNNQQFQADGVIGWRAGAGRVIVVSYNWFAGNNAGWGQVLAAATALGYSGTLVNTPPTPGGIPPPRRPPPLRLSPPPRRPPPLPIVAPVPVPNQSFQVEVYTNSRVINMNANQKGFNFTAQVLADFPAGVFQVKQVTTQPTWTTPLSTGRKVYAIPPQSNGRYTSVEAYGNLKSFVSAGGIVIIAAPWFNTVDDDGEVSKIVSAITGSQASCAYPTAGNCWTFSYPSNRVDPSWPAGYGTTTSWPATLDMPPLVCVVNCATGDDLYSITWQYPLGQYYVGSAVQTWKVGSGYVFFVSYNWASGYNAAWGTILKRIVSLVYWYQ